jgi:hypothetical protein
MRQRRNQVNTEHSELNANDNTSESYEILLKQYAKRNKIIRSLLNSPESNANLFLTQNNILKMCFRVDSVNI